METDSSGLGAFGEAVVFLEFFEDLPDPLQRAKVLYPLDKVLLLCLLAILAGADHFRRAAPETRANRLARQIEKLGFTCSLEPAAVGVSI